MCLDNRGVRIKQGSDNRGVRIVIALMFILMFRKIVYNIRRIPSCKYGSFFSYSCVVVPFLYKSDIILIYSPCVG